MEIYINENIKDKEIIYDLINKLAHKYTIVIENEISALLLLKKQGRGVYIDFNNKPATMDLFLVDYQYVESLDAKLISKIVIINIQSNVLVDQYIEKFEKLLSDKIFN